MEKIIVKNVTKIFGKDEYKGIELIKEGKSREEILKHQLSVGVQEASFSVNEGEIFVIMGLSGAGKSTMVRMLNRLIEPSSGSIMFKGKDITKLSFDELVQFRRTQMSMVFQSFALMPHLSVIENAALGLEFSGVGKEEREKRALKELEKVGLKGWEKSSPHELSGGMQQRVGLARALAASPEVLLMDEAFSALDPLIRSEMQDELLKLHKNEKQTIVFISHDLDEAFKIGDRIAIMNEGRVVQVGTPKEILLNPVDDYVEAFFRGVDSTGVITAKDFQKEGLIFKDNIKLEQAREELQKSEENYACLVDNQNQFRGMVSQEGLEVSQSFEKAFIKVETVREDTKMKMILPLVADSSSPLPVIDNKGELKGVLTKKTYLQELARLNGEGHV
ncbi:glycine betaine/L-proline ABC transporter ATP-binding protein [Bacteriovoracales bacterium]|nr:glycine betaine/L-proline ABC transporter ATP-binding protein [Bacteriovoracales bacterium]